MPIRTALFCLLLLPLCLPARADDALARLKQDLARGPSATIVLTQWCGALHYADPPLVLADQVAMIHPASAATRALLKVGAGDPVGYRRVRLTCGGHVLSEADNWYVPARLTPAMNHTLQTTQTSFGTVVKPLDFHRQTLAAGPVHTGQAIFQVRALLLTPDQTPFSLVVENYQRDLLAR